MPISASYEHLAALRECIAAALGGCPDWLDLDGRVYRFATPDKPKKQNGWYVGQRLSSGHIKCTFGAHHLKFKQTFRSWEQASTPPSVYASIADECERIRAQTERRERAKHVEAASKAARLWSAAAATGASLYLQKKGIGAYGVRFLEGSILVPVRGPDGELRGVQRIFPNGRKRFGKGTSKKGAFHVIGNLEGADLIYLVEGYATGASVFEAAGAAVVICFDAGNIASVAAELRRRYPEADIVIAADNDAWTAGNPGWSKAEAAALEHGCRVAAPDFSSLDATRKPTDFNDLHQIAGLDAVREQLTRAYRLPVEMTPPDRKRKLSRDLGILASCGPVQGLKIAFEIVKRYIRQTPRKFDLEWLLSEIRSRFKGGGERDFECVARMARGLEQKLKQEALEAIAIDAARLVHYRNLRIEQRQTLDGLAEEIIASVRRGERPLVLLKAPMGSGKTSEVLRPVAWHPELTSAVKLAVVHRQSLVADLCCRCGLLNYQDARRPDGLLSTRELGICINSLDNPKYAGFVAQTEVLLIDEVAQVCREIWNPAGTLAAAARKFKAPAPDRIWSHLVELIEQSKCVVCADADLNTLTIEALAKALPDREIRVIVVPDDCAGLTVDYGTRNEGWAEVLEALNQGQRVLIGTDSAKEAQKLEHYIKAHYPDRRVICIHAQKGTATSGTGEVQALLKNINQEVAGVDVLIYSPTVASGVSLEVRHFEKHVFFYHGAVTPSDFIQMLRRDRTARHSFLALCGRGHDRRETDPLKILANLDAAHRRVIETYQDEAGIVLRVDYATPFDERVCHSQALENKARNNTENNLLYLLQARGYRVRRFVAGAAELPPATLKQASELQARAYDQALQSALDIDADQREKYRQQYQLTPEESAQVARFDAKQCLGLRVGEALTAQHLALYSQGELASKIQRFEALRSPIAAQLRTDRNESIAALTLSSRRHHAAEAEALHHAFEVLSLNPATGQGELTAKSVKEAFDILKHSVVAPVLAYFGLLRFDRTPARPVRWASAFMEKLGLRLKCIQHAGGDGYRERVYAIDPKSWETMNALHRQRQAHSTHTHSSHLYLSNNISAGVRAPTKRKAA